VITGENKVIAPRTITVGFCLGTKRLYDFVHENPAVQFRAIEWVNNPILIKENPKMTAINRYSSPSSSSTRGPHGW
jgi:acyl-CoA hydrolase